MGRLVILDLDGTVADSWLGMLYCYKETFRAFGREEMEDEEFYAGFVGDLHDNLGAMLHIEGEELQRAVNTFRDAYADKGHALAAPFPGILDAIRELHSLGYVLSAATMKYEPFAADTFRELGVADLFDCIKGSDILGKTTKTDMIRICMDSAGASKEDTVMIGDGFGDQSAAKKAGVGFIAASYGYGITKENCIEYGIECADSPSDIVRAVRDHWQN